MQNHVKAAGMADLTGLKSIRPQKKTKRFLTLSRMVLSAFLAAICSNLWSQAGDGRPQEYIESSSPLPGGGVVTTVVQPGSIGPAVSITGNVPQGTAGGNEVSVLVRDNQTRPASESPRVAQVPAGSQGVANTQPTLNAVPQYGMPVQQTVPGAIQQVPVLGVPTTWDRSLSPARGWGCGCFGGGNQVGYGQPVFAPAPLAGVQPPPATYPPTLPNTNTGTSPMTPSVPFVPAPQSQTWTPLVQLQNLPAGTYIGQGIVGSPKAYVDGQPVRNLLRYLIIP